MKKALSLILSLALVLTLAPTAAKAYSQAYGSEVWLRDTAIQDGVTLSDNIYWSDYYSQLRQEHYITYAPGGAVSPAVSYGASVCDRTTVTAAAASYEALGYRVVGAINGDFYDTATGYPLGLLVSEGEVLSGSSEYYAVGFRADGSAIMGKPSLEMTAQSGSGRSVKLSSLNKPRVDAGGVTLMTYDFRNDHTTGTSTSGINALCTIVWGQAAIGGALTVRVESVVEGSEPLTLEENQVVLTVASAGSAEGQSFLRSLMPGETVTVSFTAAPGWEEVTEAMGALYLLVDNGQVQSGFQAGYAPRTAIGLKANGEVVLYTVDGRQTGYSMGASLKVLAERMAELGCVTALCLDGGGSTTLAASTPDGETARLINSPSESTQRKVSNHLVLLARDYASGWADHMYVSVDAPAVLVGQTAQITANLVDGSYRPMAARVTLTATAGEIVDNTFVAPMRSGWVTITASANGMSASVDILVVDTPDEMTVLWDGKSVDAVTMVPGDKAELTASAIYNHLALKTENSDYTWSVDPTLGTIDANGLLTTAFAEGEGNVTVSLGGKSKTIRLKLDADSPFVDTAGHWGGTYMASLYHKGVLAGVELDGKLYAYPDKGVTREEFAVLLARYLGVNTADYAAVEVPFADMDQVSSWAADAIRAMYALNIMGGTPRQDGTLVIDPKSTLTRAQAVTMLGRTRTESAIPADLSQFSDADKIPAYAREHFETMVSLGVVNGSYGKLDPNGTMTRAAICKVLTLLP